MSQSEPRYHALLIGIDAYNPRPLAGCVNDIDAVQKLLIERARIPAASIRRLASPRPTATRQTAVPEAPATLANLRAAFAELTREVQQGDRVFLYYSGHGTRAAIAHPGGDAVYREALVPVDVNETAERRLLFDHEFNEFLAGLAGAVTCILDCCHSGGIPRDVGLLDGTARSLDVEADLGWKTPLPAPDPGAMRGEGMGEARSLDDCHLVAACQAHQQAMEATGDDGVRHGLLTHSLLRALGGIPDDQLRTVPWSRIWQAMRASVEGRNQWQHLWMAGNLRRAVIAGPPAEGDPGLPIHPAGDVYELGAGTLASVTPSALVAVYGDQPAHLPALGTAEEGAARRGVLRVTSAGPSSALAAVEGAAFELPAGARGRVVSPGTAARLRCAILPRSEEIAALLKQSPLIELVDEGPQAQVRLEQDGTRWLLTDDLHDKDPDRALLVLQPRDIESARAVIEHYYQYTQPLRMAQSVQDLPGALKLTVLACERELSAQEAQEVQLPEAPTAIRSFYDVWIGALVCFRVQNTSSTLLRVTLLNSASSGRVQILGDQVIDARGAHVFWPGHVIGRPSAMTLPSHKKQGIDRLTVIGTTALGRSLDYLCVDQRFTDMLAVSFKDVGDDPRSIVPTEQWTAAQATIRTRAR
jgi:hypothetical protein